MSRTDLLLIVLVILIGLLIALLPFVYFRWKKESDLHWRRQTDYFHFLWESFGRARFAREIYDTRLIDLIEEAQRKYELKLSWAARAMLTIPILERLEEDRSVDWSEISSSIDRIISTMRDETAESDRSRDGARNAVSVIKAFFTKFCSIPPFCSPDDESRRRG